MLREGKQEGMGVLSRHLPYLVTGRILFAGQAAPALLHAGATPKAPNRKKPLPGSLEGQPGIQPRSLHSSMHRIGRASNGTRFCRPKKKRKPANELLNVALRLPPLVPTSAQLQTHTASTRHHLNSIRKCQVGNYSVFVGC